MKGLKKLALASAVAAAPFAQAELVAMDDAVLADMTGQAGVSIELSAEMSIGSFTYTDTDGLDGAAADAGSFTMSGITLGGYNSATSTYEGALDDIKIDIDVDATDGLMIHLGGVNSGDVLSGGAQAVDFGLQVGSADVNGAVLASNIAINGFLGPIDVQIQNDSTINVDAYFEVKGGSMNIDVLGMGISDLTIGDDSAPILTGAYASKISEAQTYAVDNATATQRTDAQAHPAFTSIEAQIAADNPALTAAEVTTAAENQLISAGAVAGVSNMAYVGMTITTDTASYGSLVSGTKYAHIVSNALSISIDSMKMDIGATITMGTETVVNAVDYQTALAGGATQADAIAASVDGAQTAAASTTLGSIAINDLDLTGTTLKIYGH